MKASVGGWDLWAVPNVCRFFKILACGDLSHIEAERRFNQDANLVQYRFYIPETSLSTHWHYGICEAVLDWNYSAKRINGVKRQFDILKGIIK
jgi:hypothetical protein